MRIHLRPENMDRLKKSFFPTAAVVTALGVGLVTGVHFATRGEYAVRPDFSALDTSSGGPESTPTGADLSPKSVVDAGDSLSADDVTVLASPIRRRSSVASSDLRVSADASALDLLLTEIAGRSPGDFDVDQRRRLIERLASLNPRRALLWIDDWYDVDGQREARLWIVRTWLSHDAAGMFTYLDRKGGSATGNAIVTAAAQCLAERGPDAVLEMLRQAPEGEVRRTLYVDVCRQWSVSSPRMTMARALAIRPAALRRDVLVEVLLVWMRGNLSAAAGSMVAALEPAERDQVLDRMLDRLYQRRDPVDASLAAALSRAVLIESGRLAGRGARAQFAATALASLEVRDRPAVARLVDTLPAGLDREDVVMRTVDVLSRRSATAAASAASLLPPGPERISAVRIAASAMAREDEVGALAWLRTLKDGADRSAAIQAVVFEARDLDAVESWLESLEVGGDADVAVQAYALRLSREDPPRAGTWARQIRDQSLRYFAIEAVARSWMRTDRAAVRSWLARTDLPRSRATRLVER